MAKSKRTVSYVGGAPNRVSASDVAASWARTSDLPVSYALGTAAHESAMAINEDDVEPSGFQSRGIFQLSKEEAQSAGVGWDELLTLDGSVRCLAAISATRMKQIARAAGFDASDPPSDALGYLAVGHNAGMKTALDSIRNYGMDWEVFKYRNRGTDWGQRIARYGDDCINSGGNVQASLPSEPREAPEEVDNATASEGDSALPGTSPSSSSSPVALVAVVGVLALFLILSR